MADLEAEHAGHTEAPKAKRTRLTAEQLADAEAAVIAAPDRKIAKIVTHYLGLEARAKAKGANLDNALSFVEANYRAETRKVTVLNAYNDFVAGKKDGSDKTEIHYKSSLKHLLKPDPNRYVHDFTVSDIEQILGRYKNLNSKRTYRRAFSAFFNWAIRHHYCLENPCDRLDKLPKDMSQIAALSLDECKRLLHAATLMQDKPTVACVAIGLFAGLRPSEIRDLKKEDILKDKIRVSGGKLRRQLKRSAPIPPVLAEWLKEFPFKGLPSGWDGKMKRLKKATKGQEVGAGHHPPHIDHLPDRARQERGANRLQLRHQHPNDEPPLPGHHRRRENRRGILEPDPGEAAGQAASSGA
jgi:integrase